MAQNNLLKQADIRAVRKLEVQVVALKADLKTAEMALDFGRLSMIDCIESGHKVERGKLTVGVQSKEEFLRVAWKEVLARRCGPRVVEEELAGRKSTLKKELVIIDSTRS